MFIIKSKTSVRVMLFVSMVSLLLFAIACSDTTSESINSNNSENELTGTVEIDGSCW